MVTNFYRFDMTLVWVNNDTSFVFLVNFLIFMNIIAIHNFSGFYGLIKLK